MASSAQENRMNLLLISIILFIPHAVGCFSSIFSFGDSLADTGNLYLMTLDDPFPSSFPPYGETYFHRPTGRCSNGRLVIDFIAEFLGLPLIQPYLARQNNQNVHNFEGGVNFAVAGVKALDAAFLAAMGDEDSFTNNSLGIQLDWFDYMLPSLCNTSSNCTKLLSSSLILMGEIGGNDFNDAFIAGKSIYHIQTYIPLVIEEISLAINELVLLGAVTFLVPGNLPIGCLPIYLTQYQSLDERQYDPSTGCLNWLNKFAQSYNDQLQIELRKIQALHPHVNIIYADYYNAMMQFYTSPEQYGFTGRVTEACCGGGGPYNFNLSAPCGTLKASACENPADFINWDGIHFTEAAYRLMTDALLKGNYTIPPISTLCVSEV